MKIELKNVKVFEQMSEETTCFHANLYVDGKKVGEAKNEGHGGPNYVHASREIQVAMEAYCKSLPPEKSEYGDLPMDLDLFLSILVEEHRKKKDDQRIARLDAKEKAKLIAKGCKVVIRINFKDGKSLWTGTRGDDVAPLITTMTAKYGAVQDHVVL